jgi:hypothetical protein
MHSRKAAYMTGRWRLSVHNTASTSDTEQYNTHYTRCPTEVPAALTTLRIFRKAHQHLYNEISPPWRMPFDPCTRKAQLNNLTTSTTTELQKAHILLSSIIFPRRRQIIPQIEWRSGSTDVYSPAIAPSVDFFGRPCNVRPGKIDNETAIAVNSFISISIKPFSRSIVSSCSNHHTHLRSCL